MFLSSSENLRTGINKGRGTERWKGEAEEIWAEILIAQKLLITGEPSDFAIFLLNAKKKKTTHLYQLYSQILDMRSLVLETFISMTVG